jgi:phage gp45-like
MKDSNPLKRAIAKIIRWAVTEAGDDSGEYQTQQITYLRRSGRSASIYPYGYTALAPADVLSVLMSLAGKSDSRAHMPISGPIRRKNLKEGENAMWHASGSYIHFKNDGDIEIHAAKNLEITSAGATNVTADTFYHLKGELAALYTAPFAQMSGPLNVSGNFSIVGGGTATLGTTVTSGGTDISNTHVHPGGFSNNDTGGAKAP